MDGWILKEENGEFLSKEELDRLIKVINMYKVAKVDCHNAVNQELKLIIAERCSKKPKRRNATREMTDRIRETRISRKPVRRKRD